MGELIFTQSSFEGFKFSVADHGGDFTSTVELGVGFDGQPVFV